MYHKSYFFIIYIYIYKFFFLYNFKIIQFYTIIFIAFGSVSLLNYLYENLK